MYFFSQLKYVDSHTLTLSWLNPEHPVPVKAVPIPSKDIDTDHLVD